MGRGAGRRSPAGVHARGRSIGTALAGRCRTATRGGDSGSTAAVGSTAVWCRAVETSPPRQCPSRPLSWPALDRRHLLDAARLLCRHVHERALRRAPPRPQCRELARHGGTLPCVLSIQPGKPQARAASAAVARVTAVSAVATARSGSARGMSPRRASRTHGRHEPHALSGALAAIHSSGRGRNPSSRRAFSCEAPLSLVA